MTTSTPSGMREANEQNITSKEKLSAFFDWCFNALDPRIVITKFNGKKDGFVCGKENPSFNFDIYYPPTKRHFYVNVGTQKSEQNAGYERRHPHFSLRSDMMDALRSQNIQAEYGVIFIPVNEISKLHSGRLQRAANLSGAHPKLAYVCSNDREVLYEHCRSIAQFLGANSELITPK